MAWPQSAQPAPAPSGGSSSLPVPALVTAVAAVLTFLFSFVRIFKIEAFGEDTGWSVWTTDFPPGLFGVGTWIPLFALLAGAIALLRAFVKGADDKRLADFSLLQVQLVAVVFAVLLWLGYAVSILLSGSFIDSDFASIDFEFGLGMLLLFIGLAGVAAGTVLDLLPRKTPGTTAPGSWAGAGAPAGTPDQGGWQQGPAPHTQPPASAPATGQWQPGADQGAPQWQPGADQGAAPQPAPEQWSQPAPPAAPEQAAPAADPQQWAQGTPPPPAPTSWDPPPPPPGQWQPDPAGGPPADPGAWGQGPTPAPAPAPPGPQPEPGPLDPQPAPPQPQPGPAQGGGLVDPGTQVIPGPPPAPPGDEVAAPPPPPPPAPSADAPPPGAPEPPPSNTP